MNDLEDELNPRRDREFTLSTGTVLGVFFALALVCAVFFGLGYTAGRRSIMPAETSADAGNGASFGSFKPAPGSPVTQAVAGHLSAKETAAENSKAPAQTYAAPSANTSGVTGEGTTSVSGASSKAVTVSQPKVTEQVATQAPAPVVRSAPAPNIPTPVPVTLSVSSSFAAQTMVQVAAVSHQEDADVLLAALKRRGYAVIARQEPQDKLIHVQLGPFPSRKDAEVMKQKLMADGYNAIVK